MQMEEEAGMGGQSREFSLRGGSHRPKHPPQERVAASVGLPGGGSPAVTPRSCWEASPQRQLPTAAREGGRGRSRPGSQAEIQFPCGAGFPWNDSPQGSTLAEARQLGNTNRTLRKSRQGRHLDLRSSPRVGGTGVIFLNKDN